MSITETLDPVVEEAVTVSFDIGTDEPLVYTQQPLSFFGKMELFSVLAGAVESALATEGGFSLAGLLNTPQRGSSLNSRDFLDANQFVAAVASLLKFAPDLFKDIYCISLKVPRAERAFVKDLMEDQLTDEQGAKLLENFIDQNWDVMKSFFYEQIVPIVEKVSQKVQDSTPSKQSKRTRRATQKP